MKLKIKKKNNLYYIVTEWVFEFKSRGDVMVNNYNHRDNFNVNIKSLCINLNITDKEELIEQIVNFNGFIDDNNYIFFKSLSDAECFIANIFLMY